MATSESNLWALVSSLEPTPAQKAAASTSHNFLREALQSGELAGRISASYLSGSYSRDTAIRPIDDVDIVFIIDPSKWPSQLGRPGVPLPSTVLESFAGAIRHRYPVSFTRGQRRSVRLEMSHLSIDVVPAIQDMNDSNFIWIPDEQAMVWLKSSPRLHSEAATAANIVQGGRLKPLIKLLKYWNKNLSESARLKSFVIETLAVTLFKKVGLPSLDAGLLIFFDYLSSFRSESRKYTWTDKYGVSIGPFAVVVPDVAGGGSNVASGTTFQTASAFLSSVVASRNALLHAATLSSPSSSWAAVRRALGDN